MFDLKNIHFAPKYKAMILTTCVKKGIVWGYYVEELLLYEILISTYLNHSKINLKFIFSLNFDTIYLF